ncbi:MAG TPA: Xaa-Pro peptidase family protein [Acidobacteriaceae bacterium]|nr:Xaa-Pro peptidase family protein [Acidobacteriaceae bacterium]
MNLDKIQSALREQNLDAWLFYDHHHRDPIAYRILGLSESLHVTRRWYYLVPAHGEPRKLVHRIEQGRLDTLPGEKTLYSTWQELEGSLQALVAPYKNIAMQYSPRNTIMYVSLVDAGTIEVLRSFDKNIVSSANLISQFEAVLTSDQIASHHAARKKMDEILTAAWREIGQRVLRGAVTEYDMVLWMREAFTRVGLTTDSGPNVSINENSADSHYDPTAERARQIRKGDFVLIDMWAREPDPGSIWYDITWTAVVGRKPTDREQQVFNTVRAARDAAIKTVQASFAGNSPIAGWQADDAARHVINDAGFGPYFTHRTGHNIATDLHGNGAHLDNFETHDERLILPDTCFSVEPGIYLPAGENQFGVRSEVNMIARAGRADVTGRVQTSLVEIELV